MRSVKVLDSSSSSSGRETEMPSERELPMALHSAESFFPLRSGL